MDASSSSGSAKGYIQSAIGGHPGSAALVVGVLVVMIIVLSFALVHYKGKCKSGFEGLETDPAAAAEAAAAAAAGAGPVMAPMPPMAPAPMAPMAPMQSPFPQVGPRAVCGRGWDPAASAEAQALATVGSLQHDSYGEGDLQTAIDGAYDSSVGLDDSQLETLMRNGDAM